MKDTEFVCFAGGGFQVEKTCLLLVVASRLNKNEQSSYTLDECGDKMGYI